MPSPKVARSLIERILHEDAHSLRLIQDSPILLDVWAAFGEDPTRRVELLLSPSGGTTPPRAAKALADALRDFAPRPSPAHFVAPLQGFVTATVNLDEVCAVLAPLLGMAIRSISSQEAAGVLYQLAGVHATGPGLSRPEGIGYDERVSALMALIRYAARFEAPVATFEQAIRALERAEPIAPFDPRPLKASFRRATLNRAIMRLGSESVRTVKADAAIRVFQPKAADLVWAVIDSGVDGAHHAFARRDETGQKVAGSRIWRTYDFTRLRRLTSFDILNDPEGEEYQRLAADIEDWRAATLKVLEQAQEEQGGEGEEIKLLATQDLLTLLATDAANERPPSWSMLEPMLRIAPDTPPKQEHGTHVAGILAGNWPEQDLVGVCPDLRLLDIRILGDQEETESAIIGALEFIRWLNSQNRWRVVHGVNLSIGMKHDVRNWACGQTPVCIACEDLVASGVVVVAAAGNDGWQSFLVGDEKHYDGYALASIMDPGNAENVITVGSTHRSEPHRYGVSFFSSRGPTGDGRMKPDLVAPGEKIEGPFPGNISGFLDGTSMAAPHVSGVAALLMARHTELQGHPREVKSELMKHAVSLRREPAAQGAGLVDAFATLQGR